MRGWEFGSVGESFGKPCGSVLLVSFGFLFELGSGRNMSRTVAVCSGASRWTPCGVCPKLYEEAGRVGMRSTQTPRILRKQERANCLDNLG